MRKLAMLYRSLGPAGLGTRLARRALATVYDRRRELVIVKRLDPQALVRPDAGDVRIEPLADEHERLLRDFNARYRTRRKVVATQAYIAHGYGAFVAFHGEEPIGYWWWVSNAVDPAVTHPCLARLGVALKDDEVFAFDYFIAPGARGQGAAVRVLWLVYRDLAALGYRGVWGSVDEDNVQARWVYRMLGNRVAARVTGLELLSRILLQDGRVYLRNGRWRMPHPFEHRLLWPRPVPVAAHDGAGAVASGLSTHGV